MSERMKRLKLYLETSVWNLLLSEEDPIRRAITESFFQQIALGGYELYVSEVVTLELARTKNPIQRQALLAAVNDTAPELLAERPELERLAKQFVSQKVFPPRYLNDARHLAYAYGYDMDVLVSWNQHHIVKLKTKILASAIAQLEGYKAIEIATPQEVLDSD